MNTRTRLILAASLSAGISAAALADDLYNTLYITDQGIFDRAFGNAIGSPPNSGIMDLQLADDFTLPAQSTITRATADYFVKSTEHSLNGVWVQIFADSDGRPAEDMFASYIATGDEISIEDKGVLAGGPPPYNHAFRISADVSAANISLPPGTWWISVQPVDIHEGGNWYWILRDFGAILGASDAGRSGGSDHTGDFGGFPGPLIYNDWIPLDQAGFRAGTAAMRVEGHAGCAADFNNDGFLDFFDIDAFLAAFESGEPSADFNHDGFLDFFDAAAFTEAFEAGC